MKRTMNRIIKAIIVICHLCVVRSFCMYVASAECGFVCDAWQDRRRGSGQNGITCEGRSGDFQTFRPGPGQGGGFLKKPRALEKEERKYQGGRDR